MSPDDPDALIDRNPVHTHRTIKLLSNQPIVHEDECSPTPNSRSQTQNLRARRRILSLSKLRIVSRLFILKNANDILRERTIIPETMITMAHSRVYSCSFCGEAFHTKEELLEHIDEKHEGIMTIFE